MFKIGLINIYANETPSFEMLINPIFLILIIDFK
jgi:hypothetical protein